MATAVIAGIGRAGGTGAAVARAYAKQHGYRVAIIARGTKDVQDLAAEIKKEGGEASLVLGDSFAMAKHSSNIAGARAPDH
jgi:NAD(P)-dependent dehydrogenase (short-subunit alcohol dehydrogenase family)